MIFQGKNGTKTGLGKCAVRQKKIEKVGGLIFLTRESGLFFLSAVRGRSVWKQPELVLFPFRSS